MEGVALLVSVAVLILLEYFISHGYLGEKIFKGLSTELSQGIAIAALDDWRQISINKNQQQFIE